VVLSFKQMPPVALAYSQVNDSFCGFVSGDQSSSEGGLQKMGRLVCSASNAPQEEGDGERAKTLPTRNN
jgi:hypothetical protein